MDALNSCRSRFHGGASSCSTSGGGIPSVELSLPVGSSRNGSERSSDDGYNWRKYGQKLVKGSEFPRSYYKCTYPNCEAKKIFERSPDGKITDAVLYKGSHAHPKPQAPRRSALLLSSRLREDKSNSTAPEQANKNGNGDVEEEEEEEAEEEEEEAEDSFLKRRKVEDGKPRVIVQTVSEVDILDDGYRWRKYGQKLVRGNPNPRSYYKCTSIGCAVRKHVERARNDPNAVITSYEGKHNHEVPPGDDLVGSSKMRTPRPSPPTIILH